MGSKFNLVVTLAIIGVLQVSGRIQPEQGTDRFDRPYRILNLQNGLTAFILQDENATIAASTISLPVGSMHDLPQMQGMAHFLEHLLFLGNKQFPDPEAFWKFAKDNGGFLNGWTADDYKGYIFSVTPENLEKGLEHLAGMVFYPIFNETNVDKEISAVDSEYERGITSSYWRGSRVLKVTSIKDHPYSQFTVGSREKLITSPEKEGLNVTQKLYEFHKQYYTPSSMSLSVIGNQSLDELEKIVTKIFGSIQPLDSDSKSEGKDFDIWDNAWGPDQLGTKTEVVGREGTEDEVDFYFPITKDLEIPFDEYYSPLLSYKCSDCLYGYLDKRGWISSLYSGSVQEYRYFVVAYISITLTPKGFEHMDEVVKAVFQYIELVKTQGPQKWFWDQYHTLQHIQDLSTTKELAENQIWSLADALVGKNDTKELKKQLEKKPTEVEFPEEKLAKILEYLVPSNMRLLVTSTKFENKTKEYETLYKVPYNYGKLEGSLVKAISNVSSNPEMKFPEQLHGLPKDFKVLNSTGEGTEEPKLIHETKHTELWHKFDTKFNVPTTSVFGNIFTPYESTSLWDSVLGSLLQRAQKQCRNNWPSYVTYTDNLLGNSAYTSWSDGHITVSVTGLSSAVPLTLKKLIGVLANCTLDEEDFKLIHDLQKNSIVSSQKSGPCSVTDPNMAIHEKYWSSDEKLEALKSLTLSDLNEFQRKVFSQIRLKWFVYGNTLAEDATSMIKDAEEQLVSAYGSKPLAKKHVKVYHRDIKVPPKTAWQIKLKSRATESNSTCTSLALQPDTHTLRDYVIIKVITRLMSVPIFNELRTNQGLGYVVYASSGSALSSARGLDILVQGAHNPTKVQGKIDRFLKEFKAKTLLKVNDTEYASVKSSQKVNWEEAKKTFRGEARRLWNEVLYEEPKLIERQSEVLDSLKIEEVVEYFERLTNKCTRRSVAFHVSRANETNGESGTNKSSEQSADGTTTISSELEVNTVNTNIEDTTTESYSDDEDADDASCGQPAVLEESKLMEWKQQQSLLPSNNLNLKG